MADTQTTTVVEPTADSLMADFEKFLEPETVTTKRTPTIQAQESEPAPDPEPAPEPEPDPEPTPEPDQPAASAAPAKIDKRTREGRKATIQQELDELTAKRHAAKAEADAEEARLAQIRAQRAAMETPPAPKSAAPPVPSVSDWERYKAMPDAPQLFQADGKTPNFASYEDYTLAVTVFAADKRYEERSAQDRARESQRAMMQTFHQKLDSVRKVDPDFDKKMAETAIDSRVFPYVARLDNAPDVLLHLHAHPDLAQRLLTLNPTEQVGQIGVLSGRLLASVAVPSGPTSKPSISQAKPLIKPVSATPLASDDDDGDDDAVSIEEHIRRENSREKLAIPGRRY
jgi:hypothetical protein